MSIAGTYRGKPYRGLSLISYFRLEAKRADNGNSFSLEFFYAYTDREICACFIFQQIKFPS
jgi:hypothetical protein